jgi:hypothetical protein
MKYRVIDALPVLQNTPQVLRALLSRLPDNWIAANEGQGTWTPFDVLGHLIHGEKTDWIPRARLILEHGAAQTFEPFDMRAQERDSIGKSISQLLDEFETLRVANVAALAGFGLTQDDLEREGTHPALGRVKLGQHLATWVAHDLGHICQIARVMAKQYKDEIGPWVAYLGVLRDREPRG